MELTMTATFVIKLKDGTLEENHLLKVSSFEDAYSQTVRYISEQQPNATLISLCL